jgi:hypothetical protein
MSRPLVGSDCVTYGATRQKPLRSPRKGCGPLQFELPLDTTDAEITYLKTLVAREELGTIELLDPVTLEVVFSLRPVMLH